MKPIPAFFLACLLGSVFLAAKPASVVVPASKAYLGERDSLAESKKHPITKDLRVAPNPNTGKFMLSFKLRHPNRPVMIRIMDNNTWVPLFEDRTEPPVKYYERFIELKNLPDGAYRIKLFQDGRVENLTVLLKRQ